MFDIYCVFEFDASWSNVWSFCSSEADPRQRAPADSVTSADSQQQNHKETAGGGTPSTQKQPPVAGSDSGSSGGSDSEEDDKHGRRGPTAPNDVPGNKSADLARFVFLSWFLLLCAFVSVCVCKTSIFET